MTSVTPTIIPGMGHEGMQFLVGEQIYLRTPESDDAVNGQSWRASIFPKSVALIRKWIDEDLPKDESRLLLIVRRIDDVIVGSLSFKRSTTDLEVQAHVDPLYGTAAQAYKAEALTLIMRHGTEEFQAPVVCFWLGSHEQTVIETVTSAGAQETARWREFLLVNGERVDRIWFEFLNQNWVKTLGNPNDVQPERTGTGKPRPVPPKVELGDVDPPKNAIMVGSRVYLRPTEKKDGLESAKWQPRETETFFDIGRYLTSSVHEKRWAQNPQEEDYPDWIQFSVCLRENDEVIGTVMLIDTDLVNQTAETGSWFFRPDYRGSGYGSEAKHLLLEWTFDVLGLHTVESWVYFPNTRSAAALRKQGYTEVGQINWAFPFEGGFGNFIVFELRAEDWRAMPRKAWDAF